MSDPDSDALADLYLFTDLSITEIEGPAEFYDWEAEEELINQLYAWEGYIEQLTQDAKDAAPAEDLGDELVEQEDPQNLGW